MKRILEIRTYTLQPGNRCRALSGYHTFRFRGRDRPRVMRLIGKDDENRSDNRV